METMDALSANTTAIVGLITSVLTLFEQYPLNILLTGSLVYTAMTIFGKGKKVAKD